MATELEELIRYWQDYLATKITVYFCEERVKIAETIRQLKELKMIKESE